MNARTNIVSGIRIAVAILGIASSLTLGGCMIGPKTGDVIAGSTIGKQLEFSGYVADPNVQIDIQVMDDITKDPDPDTSWTTFASTRSVSTPSTRAGQTGFKFDVKGTPVANASQINRWRQGGILRIRAVSHTAQGPKIVDTLDSDAQACATKFQNDPTGFRANCVSPWTPVATVVSSSPTPADQTVKPPYLVNGFKGISDNALTQAYYDGAGAPKTLADFITRFKFNQTGSDEAGAIYYNVGDLGIGREMHCVTSRTVEGAPVKACYVRNYGTFGGDADAALEDTVFRRHSFATVAMWETGGAFASKTADFVVYDANGNQLLKAQLDSTGQNTNVPNNCLACHGGNWDINAKKVSGASFLPFDIDSFKFSQRPGFTEKDFDGHLRRLNQHVVEANSAIPSPGSTEIINVINGWYAPKSVTDPTATFNGNFVPAGWASPWEGTKMYQQVYKSYCRTCHMANEPFYTDFTKFAADQNRIFRMVCKEHTMPHAEATLKNFWKSPARGYLFAGFGMGGTAFQDRNNVTSFATCSPETPLTGASVP